MSVVSCLGGIAAGTVLTSNEPVNRASVGCRLQSTRMVDQVEPSKP